jgi:hypothetical protein
VKRENGVSIVKIGGDIDRLSENNENQKLSPSTPL